MARDLKVIQRGMNVQGNDLALPAGTPIYALNADFSRDGVAQRRVGFEAFWDGLPQSSIGALNHIGKFHERLSKSHLFMDAYGMMFTYDTVGTDQWYSVPVNLPHRMRTIGQIGASAAANAGVAIHTLGRAVIFTGNYNTSQFSGAGSGNPFNWQDQLVGAGIVGTIGNDTSQATDATATQNAKFITAFDAVNISTTTYISDDTNIRGINQGAPSAPAVVAGSITLSGTTNAVGTAARFSGASWLATDATYLYIADNVNMIRKYDPITGSVTTLAGSITAGDTDGVGTAARFRNISGLAWSGSFLFVAEGASAHRIRKVDVTTGSVTIFAGALSPTSGYTNGTGTAARFNTPIGLEYSGGFLYTGDTSNNAVRKIQVSDAAVTTFAGGTGKSFANASVGLVGGVGDDAMMPSVTVRSLYWGLKQGASAQGPYLCLECTAPNSSVDLGLLYVGDGTYSGSVSQVWHYARTPDSLPTATTGPMKLDTVGPNAYTMQDIRSSDIGSGAVFTTSEKPRVLDVYNRLNTKDAFPRLRPLGIEAPEVPSVTTTTGSTFATLTAAAYRTLCGLKLPDGRVVLGPPSPRAVLTNSTGGALAGSITAYPSMGLPYDGMAFVQVYRTRTVASTADPGDQMFLCYEAPLSYGQGVSFTDIVPDDLLGAELSTNATQAGFAFAPLPPPTFANDVCEFQNSAVLANFNERASVRIKLLGVSALVNGTSTITLTTQAPGVALGYTEACSTLTLTAGTTTSVGSKIFGVTTGGSAATNAVATAKEIVRVINRNPDAMMFYAVYDDNDPGAFVVYSMNPGRSKTNVVSTIEPVGITLSYSLTQASVSFSTNAGTNIIAVSQIASQRGLNAVAYSDAFNPDAWPVVNTRLLSASQEPIIRMLPIAENLLAVKAASIWRYDQSFTEQIYDTSLSTFYPDSFARLNNAWIGLFSCGFVKLSASQPSKVGRAIERMILPMVAPAFDAANIEATTAFGASVDNLSAYACSVRREVFDGFDYWRTFTYYDQAQAWSEWTVSQASQLDVSQGARLYGIGIPGSFGGSFVANLSPPTAAFRGVVLQRDVRRTSSINTPADYSDLTVQMTGVVVSGLSFSGSYTQSNNFLEAAPPASSMVGGWLRTTGDETAFSGVVVSSCTISGSTVSGSMTLSGSVTSADTMQLYSPIRFGVLYAPVYAPANSQFGDVVVTLERVRGGSITCDFYNRLDVAYPYFGPTFFGVALDGPYYASLYPRTNNMTPAEVPGGAFVGSIGQLLEDVQRFATPIERATDQTLTVGVFEQKGAAPLAIKSTAIEYVNSEQGKVKQ